MANDLNSNISRPLVSIICTAYNHESYIKYALEGFLMQKTNFPFEIIVHDDASTDITATIIKEYEQNYPDLFVTIYQKENQYSKNINIWYDITFPYAKGKYIAICEGDDYWIDPFKLQKQVDFLESHSDYSVCFHNAFIEHIDISGKVSSFPIKSNKDTFGTEDLFKNKWFIPTASIVCRSEYISSHCPDWSKISLAGDMALLLLLSKSGKFYCIRSFMSVYRLGTASSVTIMLKNKSLKSLKNFISMLDTANITTFDFKYSREVNLRKFKYYLSVIKFYFIRFF